MTDYNFVGRTNSGYQIVEEFPHGDGTATVLGINHNRTHDRYVVWTAEIQHGRAVYWHGDYRTMLPDAAVWFTERSRQG